MTEQPKYTTVNGHEIVRDGAYRTRDGKKIIILGFMAGEVDYGVIGCGIEGEYPLSWQPNGFFVSEHITQEHELDLMEPWEDEKEIKDFSEWMGEHYNSADNVSQEAMDNYSAYLIDAIKEKMEG